VCKAITKAGSDRRCELILKAPAMNQTFCRQQLFLCKSELRQTEPFDSTFGVCVIARSAVFMLFPYLSALIVCSASVRPTFCNNNACKLGLLIYVWLQLESFVSVE
jgi:hypothetical protein